MTDIKTALISVYDKTGLEPLAAALRDLGIAMISSGGTHRFLKDHGFDVKEVSEITGSPEILGGRVKTLHPNIHGGLLARRDLADHMATLDKHGIGPIDLLVSNLYPFEATLASGADFTACVEQIDIGGPAMIRASAKNHAGVLVVTSIDDYPDLITRLKSPAMIDSDYRRCLALKAFSHTATYDAAISNWLARETGTIFPEKVAIGASMGQTLRYGENPHQQAAFYKQGDTGLAAARLIQGKALSYNNIADADAAWSLIHEFKAPAVAIIKHANPCGCAEGTDALDAYNKALKADPVSAFGGIVATNRPLDVATAKAHHLDLHEVVIVPSIEDGVAEIFESKPNLRLLVAGDARPEHGLQVKSVAGGLLVQDADTLAIDAGNFTRSPDAGRKMTKSPTWNSRSRSPATSNRTRSFWCAIVP